MKNHVSFRIGGIAPVMFFPKNEEELAFLLREGKRQVINPFVMGNGTNLLVTDEVLTYPVICTEKMNAIAVSGDTITAECGALLSVVASTAKNASLGGMEFAHGIPGSIGGGISMNAGAYGGEMKDIVLSVRALDRDGNAHEYTENNFSYRHSRYTDSGEIVISAVLRLNPAPQEEIFGKMEELGAKRRASQPLNMPSAGSTFKRPVGGYAAALIEEAGLKGFRVGGAEVSTKHAGFVVNAGGASFADVCRLMEEVQKKVFEKSGIVLEPEVKFVR